MNLITGVNLLALSYHLVRDPKEGRDDRDENYDAA